ncbi:hypothetical protein TVNIR_0214 [Thioalkalivibrio nitratireducens DSM 14787]|uniref:Uncharacterized protein n=1 Tax=Thioalkalivibrio nitratireducens (strain DSM 14787 / UNIQEM 213 / ALEN2) TaxID=1255043 RepID=L0DSH6_THIND|nr:hypothetical protein TVNIR_0214 [Thioalkalivibrio nitratireducens DSM 14787]
MASEAFLALLVTAATVITTLSILVLLGLLVRDWIKGTLW